MKPLLLLLLIAAQLAIPASAGTRTPEWHAFFAQVLPLVPKNFAPIKGALIPGDDVYYAKAKFNPKLVANCHVFTTGAKMEWHMRCDNVGYTSLDALAADVGAALPGFKKGANMIGQPRWSRGQTYVTIVALGGVLISHGDPDNDS